ncbi:MAG: type II toxin-antitoxin system VapC family toxin [Sphingomonas sp.]|nr:type II toxin-antitoxin system VapC family toxin [Sphingomonas sp.]
MILVDTNVWSEAIRAAPHPVVQAWAMANDEQLWMSTVVIGELLSGVDLMPPGQRRTALEEGYRLLIDRHHARIVPFDLDAAKRYAVVLGQQYRAGRNPGTADTQIAATALSRGLRLATRNTQHFEGLGIDLINPWQP